MAKVLNILAINPGSTSTKIGFFHDTETVFTKTINHSAEELEQFPAIPDQLDFRTEAVLNAVKENGVDISTVDAFVGRGGGLMPCPGGVFEITEKVLADAKAAVSGAHHPAELASQICAKLIAQYGGKGYIVNPPDTDEFQDLARITGLKGVYRESRIHALNQKEIALRYCAANGVKYEEQNLIIAHLGGGISITAHRAGKMVDSNDILAGEGPLTPTRVGALPTTFVLKMAQKEDPAALKAKLTKKGGLIDHFGTDDARVVEKAALAGEKYPKLVYDAMIYQIGKYIGEMACVLKGKVDAIILTGGMAHGKYLTDQVKEYTGWIAPVVVMAGEFEMEALAAGAYRVINGEEEAKVYTGIPPFTGFDFE